jgi:hypothetical protein
MLFRSWTNDVAKPRPLWLTIKAREGAQFKAVAESFRGSHGAEGTFKDGAIDWKVPMESFSWEGKLVGKELVGTFKGRNWQGDLSGEFRLTLADGLRPTMSPARIPPVGPARGAVGSSGWTVVGDQLINEGLTTGLVTFGDQGWTDYDFTFEARKSAGHGLGAHFRGCEGKCYVLILEGPGYNHSIGRYAVSGQGSGEMRSKPGTIQPLEWYKVKISLRGPHIRIELDDHKLVDLTDEFSQQGNVSLKCWDSAARFRNIKATAPNGTVLWEGPPELLEK